MTPEELLKSKNIDYQYSGGDLLIRCLNPEHEDRNPSLRVDRLTGKHNCFSCGFSGSIFQHFNVAANLIDIRILELKDKMAKINKPVLYKPLTAQPFEKEYRGIGVETFKHFDAYTDPNSKEFEGRIIFPITNINNEIVCFHARYLHSELSPKYITKPEGSELPIFPAMPKIINGSIILVEGYFDMLNLYDKGLKNTVCAFGCSLVSKADRYGSKILKRLSHLKLQGVSKIFIMFDGDRAGRDGARKLKNAIKENYIVEIIELPDDTDPGNLTQGDVDSIREYINE